MPSPPWMAWSESPLAPRHCQPPFRPESSVLIGSGGGFENFCLFFDSSIAFGPRSVGQVAVAAEDVVSAVPN